MFFWSFLHIKIKQGQTLSSHVHGQIWPHSTQFCLEVLGSRWILLVSYLGHPVCSFYPQCVEMAAHLFGTLGISLNTHYSQTNHCNDNYNDFSYNNDIIAPLDKLIMLHYSQKKITIIITMICLTIMTLLHPWTSWKCRQGCNNVTFYMNWLKSFWYVVSCIPAKYMAQNQLCFIKNSS